MIAAEKRCTPAQLALAWMLARHKDVVPTPGTSSVQRLEEKVRAVDVARTGDDLDRIERVSPQGVASGARYDPAMLDLVDQEVESSPGHDRKLRIDQAADSERTWTPPLPHACPRHRDSGCC